MKFLTTLLILFIALISFGQNTGKNEIIIHTSAECGSCKERIEDKLNYTAGVKFAELDIQSKELTVKFNPKKISEKQIKKIISELGYDADDVKANPTSTENLPKCCQPGGMK